MTFGVLWEEGKIKGYFSKKGQNFGVEFIIPSALLNPNKQQIFSVQIGPKPEFNQWDARFVYPEEKAKINFPKSSSSTLARVSTNEYFLNKELEAKREKYKMVLVPLAIGLFAITLMVLWVNLKRNLDLLKEKDELLDEGTMARKNLFFQWLLMVGILSAAFLGMFYFV